VNAPGHQAVSTCRAGFGAAGGWSKKPGQESKIVVAARRMFA